MAKTNTQPTKREPTQVIGADTFKTVIDLYSERIAHKRIVIMECDLQAPKTSSGIVLPDSGLSRRLKEEADAIAAQNHKAVTPKNMYDSKTAVVIACSKACDQGCKPGDIIRFSPLSAHSISFDMYSLLLINEMPDLQTVIGNISDTK